MTIPVTILTGFLGAGKTTLLNSALRHPHFAQSLVIVNELGRVPLDHLLVRQVREDVLVLDSGCVCCSVRGDLVNTLSSATEVATGGSFDRVLVETTGLADPTPIVATLARHHALTGQYHLDAVVTVVDGEHGHRTLAEQPEAMKQLLVADEVIISKRDRVDAMTLTTLRARLEKLLGGGVRIHEAAQGAFDWEVLRWSPATELARYGVMGTWPTIANTGPTHHAVHAFAVHGDLNVHFPSVALWLSMASQLHGAHLLRVKGLLGVTGEPGPLVIQAVQHVVHPTYTMSHWPSNDHRSRVQVISRGLSGSLAVQLQASLARALSA